ncbi:MAG: uracil-DNA glycosylase [Candidatus Omnitrophota bacterium]|jgi:DNA polymerase
MADDTLFFLKSLKEDGIEHLYLTESQPPAATSNSSDPKKLTRESPELSQSVPSQPASSESAKTAILNLRDKVLKCRKCPALVTNRNKIVFGAGNIRAQLVFVGEAPGRDEDLQGIPFVGRAGQLLTKIIEAMGMTRREVFICNVLKCRPPQNRPPAPDEVIHCRPYLKEQLRLIAPKIIVALGNHACQALLSTDKGISQLRGSLQEYEGIPVMCTYHPAYLLRNPAEKKKVWEDMKKVMAFLKNASHDAG